MTNKSELTKKIYSGVRNIYNSELVRAKDSFYETKVGQAEGNIKSLYAVTSDLLGRSRDNPLPFNTIEVSFMLND